MYASRLCSIARLFFRCRRFRATTMLCSLLLFAASIVLAMEQPGTGPKVPSEAGLAPSTELARLDIPALKTAYLECDRAAAERLLALDEATVCSQLGEVLLTRAFNRDFSQLLAWWRTEKTLRQSAQVGAR